MAQSTENTTYTAFPNQLFDDLVQGKIDNTMFNLLVWLYRRALWKNGIATRASSQQMIAELWGGWTYEKNPPSERTIQEKLRRLVQMGYIVSHHTAGRRGTYSISINNYPALTPAGEEIILRPTETKSLDEVLAAFCGDDSGESSAESSGDPAVSLPRTHSTTLDSPALHPTNHSTEDQPRVSELVRSAAVAASMLAVEDDSADPKPTPREQMLLKALGIDLWLKGEVSSLRSILKFMSQSEFWSFWHWNQQHKSGKLQFFTVSQALSAIDSNSPRSAIRQWKKHEKNSSSCPKRCGRVLLPMEITDQEFWDNLVEYNLVGNVGVKWYTGKSPEEAISGYHDKDSLLKDLFEDRNYELRAKLENMICEASGGYVAEAFERECICELPKESCSICGVPERGIFEIEEDLG